MECELCGNRNANALNCITCARNALEVPRIELAKTLIERDKIGRHVKAVVEGSEEPSSQYVSLSDSKGGFLVDRAESTKTVVLQRLRSQTTEHEERILLINEEADRLRETIEATRKRLEAKRAAIAQHKSDLSSVTYGIEKRRANEVDKVQHNIKKLEYKMIKCHRDTMEARMHMCNLVARLAGLKMGRRKAKDGEAKDVYTIGPGTRLRIYDLKDLHDAQPDNLSASLGLVALLLVRVASYLGVRLPAEITLPHNDYPLATIFRPNTSYMGKKVPFPTPNHSSSNSPEASRTLDGQTQLPKPRTLFLDRPLAHLAVQDAPAYSLFIEGVSLLAYDIAWLCRTQGLKEDFDTWEDVSPMGRNLYRLLITQETHAPAKPENPLDKELTPKGQATPIRTSVGFGEVSHVTSHAFLNAAKNEQFLSNWRLTPTKITDELRSFLLAEQAAAEWDVVSQKEWEDMEDMISQSPVMVGMKKQDQAGGSPSTRSESKATSFQTDKARESGRGDEKKSGTSGWTKLKSRNEE